MKSTEPSVRGKICVIFPGALGDFVCFLPALQALACGGAIDLFARNEFAGLAPEGVTVRSIESPAISRLFRSDLDDKDGILREFFQSYDEVYSWFASGNRDFTRRLVALTGSRAKVFPFRPAELESHQVEYYLGCLNRIEDAASPRIMIRPEARGWAEDFWSRYGLYEGAVLTIAPGSGAREKNWPEAFFLAVCRWWRDTIGGGALLLIGPVEQERGGIELLRRQCVVAENLDLAQTAALLTRSFVYLGNDSGLSHLAAATGARTVALFGPSNPRQWEPRGEKVVVLRRNLDCSPCNEPIMKVCPHRACLTKLSPEKIIATMARLPEVITLTR